MNRLEPTARPDRATRVEWDAEIEAIVAEAIAAEAAQARREAAPPSSAIVWWRAQMRARQEATKAIERPLTIVHGLAIACLAGLLVSVIGIAISGVKGSLATIDLTSRWILLPMTAMLVSVVVASIAAIVIFADE